MPSQLLKPPNLLSLYRLLAAFPAAYCLYLENFLCSAFLYLTGAVSDFLDGFVARRFGMETKVGILLDPLADKVLIGSYIAVLYLKDFHYKPSEVLVLSLLLKEFVVLLGTPVAVGRGVIPKPNIFGKISTALLFLDGILLLYGNWSGYDIRFLQYPLEGIASLTLLTATGLYIRGGTTKGGGVS